MRNSLLCKITTIKYYREEKRIGIFLISGEKFLFFYDEIPSWLTNRETWKYA